MGKYKPKLGFTETEVGIKLIKDCFERKLAKKLSLLRVTAPKFLVVGTGLQDDLAGTQEPIGFHTKFIERKVEIVHSLAKWKRHTLWKRGFPVGKGIYTDMDAIRKDELADEIHSIYVDQWDWELMIGKGDRTLGFLKNVVRKIYSAMIETEREVARKFPHLKARLPREIRFIHSEALAKKYPGLTSAERETKIAKKFGAVFIVGIGHELFDGKPHDLRAADYDGWSTLTSEGRGLNGDIIVWDKTRARPLELSSMGIRVDADALKYQLGKSGSMERTSLPFHSGVLSGKIPPTIGGGIGQSRLCQLLLHKAHIGEVQSSIWPDEIHDSFGEAIL
ncbi:MAG: aspartate--ammonia ligase [archaeon]